MNKNNKVIDFLQVYRAIAALMVVVFHICLDLPFYFKRDFENLQSITAIGKFGVDFFFVLSGFIISYSYFDKEIKFKSYVLNRFLRIYLPYLPIGLFLYFAYTFLPQLSNGAREFNFLATFTLLPVGEPSLSVAWTLMHEMLFYAIFAISMVNVKYFNRFLSIWMILIVLLYFTKIQTTSVYLDYFLKVLFSPYNIEFVLGYISFLIIKKKGEIKNALLYGVILIVIFIVLKLVYVQLDYFVLNLIFSFSCMFFIFFAYNSISVKINKSSLIMKLGYASYSIYLIHLPVQAILFRLIPHSSVIITFTIIITVAVFVALIYSHFFENKFLFLLKKKLINN
ncbi:MAG TPA: acyltransferase [Flavobacterium sp.]|nr:acyltransferase [Flavobacterium sp.]